DAPADGQRPRQGRQLAHRTTHRPRTGGVPPHRRRLQHPPDCRPTAPERAHRRSLSRVHQDQTQFEERHRTGPARLPLGPSGSGGVTNRIAGGRNRRLVGNISKAGTAATSFLSFFAVSGQIAPLTLPCPLLVSPLVFHGSFL